MRRAAVVLVCLAVVLGGCRPGLAPEQEHGAPTFTALAVPAALASPTETVWGLGLVAPAAPADAVPGVLVGVRADAGGVPALGVWTVAGDSLTPVTAEPGVPGAVVAVEAAGSPGLTAIAGYAWDDGRHHAFVLTSTDRVTWTPVELPDAAAHLRPEVVTVAGSRVHVVATDPGSGLWSLTVTDGAADVIALGEGTGAADGEGAGTDEGVDEVRRSPVGVAARGDQVIVVAAHEAPGATSYHAYLSPDAGTTWGEPVAIEHGDRAFVSGVLATSTAWVALGGLPPGRSSDALRPAAWHSADGAYWVREDVVPHAIDPDVEEDAWLSGASTAGDDLASLVLIRDIRRAFLVDRSADGEWSVRAEADGTGVHGEVDFVAQPSGAGALRSDGNLDVVLFGAGAGQVDRVAPDGTWTTVHELGAPFRGYEPYRVAHREGAVALSLVRERFETTSTGWIRAGDVALVEVSGADLRERAWDPDSVGGATGVVQASAPDGTEVVLAERLDGRVIEVHGHVRSVGATDWRDVTGFARGRVEEVASVTWTEHGWFAVGHTGDDLAADERDATLWTAGDGAAWSVRDDVEWPTGTGLRAVCRAADGRALVVGSVPEPDTDEGVAAAWLTDGGAPVSVTGLGAEGGVSGCVEDGDRVVLVGEVDGRSTLWTLARDATEVTQVHEADRVDDLGLPVVVDGGYVAWGRVEGAGHTGPVVWLSRDLETWWHVPVPAVSGAGHGVLAADGGDVVVVASTRTGVQAWRLAGVRDALRAGPPSA